MMLDQRMKSYELEQKVPIDNYLIARLDGWRFHTFTRGFEPFSNEIHLAMVQSAEMIMRKFKPVVTYIQSDEITVVFKPSEFGFIFNGRCQKMASIFASVATVEFNKALESDKTGYFDCRIFGVPTVEEAANNLLWRHRDCIKNAKNKFAQTHFSHKQLLGVDSDNQVLMCEKAGFSYNISDWFKFGTFCAKGKYYNAKLNFPDIKKLLEE